ncbi:hypothetical protein WCLP8_180002 [uncultured Gammaproteobacteria bacterium]
MAVFQTTAHGGEDTRRNRDRDHERASPEKQRASDHEGGKSIHYVYLAQDTARRPWEGGVREEAPPQNLWHEGITIMP